MGVLGEIVLILIQLIGAAYAAVGIIIVLSPVQYIDFWKQGKRIHLAGILALLFGVVLLSSALRCRWPWFVIVLGVLGLIEGVTIFSMGSERIKSVLSWWDESALLAIRLIGLVTLALGILLFYSA